MMEASSPIGTTFHLPETFAEDWPYFTSDRLAEAANYYEAEGYVVLRGLVPSALCDRIRGWFDHEVRSSAVPILRQKNMRYERNTFDADGFLSNPVFNIQDLETRRFAGFKQAALDALTHPNVIAATAAILATARTKLIQSMFFEAPAGTWAHQDSYYQDSATKLGGAVAGWFALEDIDAAAGRFYVCPRSHRAMQVLRNEGELDFAFGHERYQRAVLDAVRARGFEWRAPYLAKGDVLLWSSSTVHGSLPAGRRGVSRSSLTAHYLREGDEMLQFHTRIRHQKTAVHQNGATIGLLHDQDDWRNRLVREAAWRFPAPFALARKLAMKALLMRQRAQQATDGANPRLITKLR